MIIYAIVCLGFGIPVLLIPDKISPLFGMYLDSGGILMARLYGGALLANFLVAWFSRNDTGSISLYAVVLYIFVYNSINFFVALWATIAGIAGLTGFSIVAIYLFFAVGYGFVLLSKLKIT